MNTIRTAFTLFAFLFFATICRADEPATEFFAIETSKLAKLAPGDADLDTLSATQLSGISTAHGWYDGGLSMRFLADELIADTQRLIGYELPADLLDV